MRAQQSREFGKSHVLRVLERQFVAAFEFDAERKIIALLPVLPAGNSGMPGALCAGHKLDQFAIASDQEMRRYSEGADGRKIGMGAGVEGIGEQTQDIVAAELRRRQADRMDDDQLNGFAGRAVVVIGRDDAAGSTDPAVSNLA